MILVAIQVVLLLSQLACLFLFVAGGFFASPVVPAEWIPAARFLSIWLVVPAIIITLLFRARSDRSS